MLGCLRHGWRHAGCPMLPYTATQVADLCMFGRSWAHSSRSSSSGGSGGSVLAPAATCSQAVQDSAGTTLSHAHSSHHPCHRPPAAGVCGKPQQAATQPASPASGHARAAPQEGAAHQLPASMPQQSAILGSCHHLRWRGSTSTHLLSFAQGPMRQQPAGFTKQPARWLAAVRKPSPAQRQAQRDRQVRVVFEDGTHEVMLRSAADSLASRQGLDLVMVADKANPPVVKLAARDLLAKAAKKHEKEQRKRESEQRRRMAVKEVRVGALIAEGDLQRLLGQARSFVDKGFRVKLVVRFGHWQRANGEERLRAVVEQVKQWSHVTAPQSNEKMARNTFMVYLTHPPGKSPSSLMPAAQPSQAAAAVA